MHVFLYAKYFKMREMMKLKKKTTIGNNRQQFWTWNLIYESKILQTIETFLNSTEHYIIDIPVIFIVCIFMYHNGACNTYH